MAFGEYFMTRPPSEVESALAPWGGNRVVLEMIGGPYAFSGLSVQQSRWIREHLETLCNNSTACTPASETEVCRASEDLFKPIDVRGWEYTYERDYQLDHVSLAGLCFFGRVTLRSPCCGRLWTSATSPENFEGVFENFLRVLVTYRIAARGGILLHSAAIAKGGRAILLAGNSGAGKSTASKLALDAGWEVLSDDLNALMPEGAAWTVEKVPFAGDLGSTTTDARSYPLDGVFWLEKADRHGLVETSKALLLAHLLSCAPLLNEDPFRVDQALATLNALVLALGRGTLRFARDEGFLGLLMPNADRPHGN